MGRMHHATVKWLKVDDYEGWVLQFENDRGIAEARRMKGDDDKCGPWARELRRHART